MKQPPHYDLMVSTIAISEGISSDSFDHGKYNRTLSLAGSVNA